MKLLRNSLFFTLLTLAQAALGFQHTELKEKAESAYRDSSLNLLFEYIKAGNLQEVKATLKAMFNTLHDKNTPLLVAIKADNLQAVQLLIDAGADVNKAAYKGAPTPLLEAAGLGHVEIVKLLLAAQANIHIASYPVDGLGGSTPMVAAAENGHIAVLEALLSKNININENAPNGHTPLTIATEKGRLETIQFLLKHKADINKTTNSGLTALALAAQHNKPQIVKLLLAHGAKVNHALKDAANLPLYIAIKNNYQEIIEFLINAKANLEIVLLTAIKEGNYDIVKFLITKGVNINAQLSPNKTTPLHSASAHNHVDTVKSLLLAGADPNKRDNNSATPLTWACAKNNQQIIRLLLGVQSNISEQDLGNTDFRAKVIQLMSPQTKRLYKNAISGNNQKLFTAIRTNDPVTLKNIILGGTAGVFGDLHIYDVPNKAEEKEKKEQAENTKPSTAVFWNSPLMVALECYDKYPEPKDRENNFEIIGLLSRACEKLWDVPNSRGFTPIQLVFAERKFDQLIKRFNLGPILTKPERKSDITAASSSASVSTLAASSSSSAPALAVTASPTSSVLGKRKAPHTSPEKDDEQQGALKESRTE